MIRILLVTLFIMPMAIYAQNEIIFSDDMGEDTTKTYEQETILIDDSSVVESEPVLEQVAQQEAMIVDDVHEIPTIIKTADYMSNDSAKKPTFKKVDNSNVKIIKYINPMLNKLNLNEPTNKTDFWTLLGEAMQKSASLILKKHDMKITKANLAIIKSEYYPNLSLKYYNEYYHGFSRGSSASIGGSYYPGGSEYRNSLNLNLDYEVYRFGASDLKKEMANQDVDIIKSEIELEKERIAKGLLDSFTRALKAQESIRYKKRIILIKSLLLKNTQRLYDAGFASKVDIARLRVDLVHIEKDILRSRLNIVDALKDIEILSNVKLDLEKVGLSMLEPNDAHLREFIDSAKASNIRLRMDKKIKEMELIKKDYLPTLYANGAYQIYGGDKDHFFDAIGELERNNWNIGFTLKWDIFNGFKTDNSIEKKKLEISKLVEEYRLQKISFKAKREKRAILKEAIAKIMSEESMILDETSIEKELLTRLQKAGNISIMEVDKIEVSRLNSELDFKLQIIDQVKEEISSQLTM